MPLAGVRPREVQRAAARPAPSLAPSQAPARPTPLLPARPQAFGPGPGSPPPFHQALQQATQRVVQATAAGPKRATPYIPRLSNPTPQQTHAALQLIAHSQRLALGPNPSAARVRAYQAELANDPRQADFLDTARHYVSAAEAHAQALEGRRLLWGALEESKSPSEVKEAVSGVTDAEARAIAQSRGRYLLPNLVAQAQRQTVAAQERSWLQGEQQMAKERATGKGSALDLGFVNLTPLVTGLAQAKVPGIGGVAGGLVNEAFDLPAQTFLSSAILGSQFRQDIGRGEYAKAAELLPKTTVEGLEQAALHPTKAPLANALQLAGGEAALGGIFGRLEAAGAEGLSGTERAAALVRKPLGQPRPDLQLTPGEAIVGRRYNADPIRRALQKLYEQGLTKAPGQLRQESPFQATGWRLRRNMVGGITKIGRVDRIAAAGEDTRRGMAKGTIALFDKARPTNGTHDVLPWLIAQRAVRTPATALADATGVLEKWKGAQAELKGSQLKTNRANVSALESALHVVRQDPSQLQPAFAAAERHVQLSRPFEAERVYGGQVRAGQLRAALFPYAMEHMGAVYKDGALKAADGSALSDQAILDHMRAHGVQPPGFVSHRAGIGGRSSHYKPTTRQPGLERFQRSGEAFNKGIADASWEALRGSLADQASKAAQLAVRRGDLNRLSFGGPFDSTELAAQAADNFHATPEGEAIRNSLGPVVPVHLGSGQIMEQGHIAPVASTEEALRQFGLEQHTPIGASDSGRFALIPRQVAERMQAHTEALGTKSEVGRALQLYQQAFRRAKLNTSIPHIAGVVQEQLIRLGAEGAGPTHAAAGAKITRNLQELAGVDKHGAPLPGRLEEFAARALPARQDVATARANLARALGEPHAVDAISSARQGVSEAEARLLQVHEGMENVDRYRQVASALANRGGQAGSQRANDVVRKGDQFSQTSALGYLVHGSEGALKSKAGEALTKPWEIWKASIEGSLARVEHGTRNALLAKALKDTGLIDSAHQVVGMTDDAVKALIKGKLTPNMADRLAEAVDNMGGNWNRQTPAVRKAVGFVAPFGLWWLNSMRWLYRLPVTHPVKTAIAAALYQATREQRNAKGQGYDAAHPVPSFLQGTIGATLPLVGEGHVAPTYYTPGGTLGPEAFQTAVDLVAPWASGIYAAARGQNPLSGAKLETAQKRQLSAPQIGLNVLGEILAGPTPFATQAQKALTKGGKPYGTANILTELADRAGIGPPQVKPGTERPWLQVVGKLISPTRFDFPSAGESGLGPAAPNARLSPAQEARVQRAIERSGGAAGGAPLTPAQAARIRRAEERYDQAHTR